ncbi:type II toxin-antitoxin system RelE/ParE family toxin [Sphingobacterium phlebotomi]|uniref:Type II toxin-antitoxin system RelE/ParE family toxin n=1 Tax=Sphingobacterium phlebotomi TaxID=2605433 RepID=A0A5D4H6U8_9SPHI|nr:type II toxin-antitoxin system RelE/ParE family toxin [Sphingobacterium phlebotomi]TYR36327.1 type II toxin-antitoxin system RelE/ParE family toxin [Sphingobacterium phlebotomi]
MALYEIELSQKALYELDEAYEWYEEQLSGLGTRLLKEVNKYLTTISKSPKLFQVHFPNEIRMVPLKVFPYLIVYWIDETNAKVAVLSIFHAKRHPSKIL